MKHYEKANKHSSSRHDLPQHEKNNGRYPSGPAPGGANTPAKSSYFQRIKEKFKKPEEKPATKEEVQQLRLNAQREQARYTRLNYTKRTKELKRGNGGWQGLFAPQPSPRRRGSTGSKDLGFFSNSNDNAFGSGEGAMGMFGAGPQPKTRGKKQEESFGSGLTDLF